MERKTPALAFGKKLRSLRKKRKLSLTQLGHKALLTESHISSLEYGKQYPRAQTLFRLAKALEVPMSELTS